MKKYYAGQIVEGVITGIQSYGAFVSLDKYCSGLIHISEISDGFVRDIRNFVNVGEVVKVKVVDYDEATNQAKLSLKALKKGHTRKHKRQILSNPTLPIMRLGFQTIANNLQNWIEEAQAKNDEV